MKTSRRRAITSLTAAGLQFLTKESISAENAVEDPKREVVTGIGGFFFRAHDPKLLAVWYQEHLGITITPRAYTDAVWTQQTGPTVLTPFPESTTYFGDPTKQWLINFRVRDLEKLARQLETAGIAVKRDPETYPNGHFARIHDPEGNPIELWQPGLPH